MILPHLSILDPKDPFRTLRYRHIMRHDDDGLPFPIDIFEYPHDIIPGFCIDIACRFIRKDNRRVIRKGTRNRYTLLFATAHLRWLMGQALGKLDHLEKLLCFFRPRLRIHTSKPHRKLNIL